MEKHEDSREVEFGTHEQFPEWEDCSCTDNPARFYELGIYVCGDCYVSHDVDCPHSIYTYGTLDTAVFGDLEEAAHSPKTGLLCGPCRDKYSGGEPTKVFRTISTQTEESRVKEDDPPTDSWGRPLEIKQEQNETKDKQRLQGWYDGCYEEFK